MNAVVARSRGRIGVEVRQARARFKDELRSGRRDLCVALIDPPREAEGMQIADLLALCPGLGAVRINWILDAARINPVAHVGTLTAHQRAHLVLVLRRNHPRLRGSV